MRATYDPTRFYSSDSYPTHFPSSSIFISLSAYEALVPDTDADSTLTAAAITAAILGFKIAGPFGALAGATFANHYGKLN